MNVRKFYARTSREALKQVKEAFGPDAIILANRPAEGGVEILAASQEEVLAPACSAPATAHCGEGSGPREAPAAESGLVQALIEEIKSMRGILEEGLAFVAWGDLSRRDPARAQVLREFLAAGFSPSLARQVLEKLPVGLTASVALARVKEGLVRSLPVIANEEALLDQGGIYALMGPTGVGKTTTTAKLAARCVVRHGAQKVALLTTDGYRIGAHEQLRIYGRILGVPVHAVKDGDDLRMTLEELHHKHMILIDTEGRGQRDQMVAEQVAMLHGCGTEVKRLLLLSATCNRETLEDVVAAYRGSGLAGCIITKIDEAVSAGAALDMALRHRLTVHYVANGQRVPEDLHVPNPRYLIDRAFRDATRCASHGLEDSELAAVMGQDSGRALRPEPWARGVRPGADMSEACCG